MKNILKVTLATSVLLTGVNLTSDHEFKVEAKTVKTYTVKKGDNLFRIAKNHGVTLNNLKKINKLNSNIIKPGQKLKLKTPSKKIKQSKKIKKVKKTKQNKIKYNKIKYKTPADYRNWHALAMCESRNTPDINTGNGFYGAYQFNLQTWHGVGGTGYPHQNSLAEQTKRAKILYNMRGAQPWPSCGVNL